MLPRGRRRVVGSSLVSLQTRCAPRCRVGGSSPASAYPNEQSATELPEQLIPAFIAQYHLTHLSGD